MSKSLTKVALLGMLADGTIAKAHQAKEVKYFSSSNGSVKIFAAKADLGIKQIIVSTKRGSSQLPKNPTNNIYHGIIGQVKVHVSLKKVVGELRYWA